MPNDMVIKPCCVIPCYRHADELEKVILKLQPYNLPLIVVDDGNSKEDIKVLENLQQKYGFTLAQHKINQGKGFAVSTGLKKGFELGFTLAIQVDSDGQHNLDDINTILKMAKEHPNAVISGAPVYDDKAPKSRVIGRKITNFFVHLETMSKRIVDAMIGFRAYPLERTVKFLNKNHIESRMNFDIEILVRLFWEGVPTYFFTTKVDYPEGGVSNFRGIDNFKISMMHTKLCTLAILTLPVRIFKNAKYQD